MIRLTSMFLGILYEKEILIPGEDFDFLFIIYKEPKFLGIFGKSIIKRRKETFEEFIVRKMKEYIEIRKSHEKK